MSILPFQPAGATGTVARTVAQKPGEALIKPPAAMENERCANGIIDTELVARAAPDL